MAPSSEYATGGGKLKIKGVKGGRVEKKKKKKNKEKSGSAGEELRTEGHKSEGDELSGEKKSRSGSRDLSESREEQDREETYGKTEAERRYDEARKKRVCFDLLLPLFVAWNNED